MNPPVCGRKNAQNGTSHYMPLPVQVMEAIHSLPRVNEWVFVGQKGQHWSVASAQKTWGIIRRRWGLEDVVLHDLRRSCASLPAIEGENLPTIQSVLNHRSLSSTSVYARLNTKAVDRALQAQADRLCLFAPSKAEIVSTLPTPTDRPLIQIPAESAPIPVLPALFGTQPS
jgi:integrase